MRKEIKINYNEFTVNYLAVLHNKMFGYWIEYDGGKIGLREMIINSFEKHNNLINKTKSQCIK